VLDPELRRPLAELGMVRGVAVGPSGAVRIDLALTIVGCPAADRIERDVRAAATGVTGVTSVHVELGVMTPQQRAAVVEAVRGVKQLKFGPGTLTRVFAVTSGKGGVGKSTLAANLAVAFAARGLAVGVLDADVHGYSIPGLLGIAGARPTRVDDLVIPPVAHGVSAISIGMFTDGGEAVSWRGPMLHRTIEQFLTDVHFGDLDVLVLDLPPGTGDVAISVGQFLPNAEVVVVTTPQSAAAGVAERSGRLARRMGQRIVGVVETMSGLPQPDGSVLELFGSGGGDETAERLSEPDAPVPVLGRIPISVALRAGGDAGAPIVATDPTDAASRAIIAIADALLASGPGLAGRPLL
jgi:ATP-binding protein involved in chromosome partitioning